MNIRRVVNVSITKPGKVTRVEGGKDGISIKGFLPTTSPLQQAVTEAQTLNIDKDVIKAVALLTLVNGAVVIGLTLALNKR